MLLGRVGTFVKQLSYRYKTIILSHRVNIRPCNKHQQKSLINIYNSDQCLWYILQSNVLQSKGSVIERWIQCNVTVPMVIPQQSQRSNSTWYFHSLKTTREIKIATVLTFIFSYKNKKAQLSLTNPRDAKACQKLLQFDVLTTWSLTILVYLHSFRCCCVQNQWNPEKFSENSNL